MPRRYLPDRPGRLLALCLLLLAAQQLSGAALIQAKASLAPVLIEQAWLRSRLQQGQPVKPWPWADTWPVARLQVPSLGIDQLVLAGDSGHALAFGPGHTLASAALGSTGLAVIGGHRDTHFAFLRRLRIGELVRLELPAGPRVAYRVVAAAVVDTASRTAAPRPDGAALQLVTCYPFETLQAGGSLRYVVTLQAITAAHKPVPSTLTDRGVFPL